MSALFLGSILTTEIYLTKHSQNYFNYQENALNGFILINFYNIMIIKKINTFKNIIASLSLNFYIFKKISM